MPACFQSLSISSVEVVVAFKIYTEPAIWGKVFFPELLHLTWDACSPFLLNDAGVICAAFEEGCL